jgi:hypothetical protein
MGPGRAALLVAPCVWLVVAVGHPAPSAAQDHSFELWTAAFLDARIPGTSDDLGVWTDLHVRRGAGATQLIVRPAVFYRLLDPLTVWAGYAWTPLFRDGASHRQEHRAWQQVQLAGELDSGLGGSLRTRFEQRFVTGSGDVGWRLRQLVRGQYRVSEHLMLVLWHELFVGLGATDWGMPRGLDLSRWFAGPAYVFRRGLRIETGYLGQLARREPRNVVLHALSVNLYGSW